MKIRVLSEEQDIFVRANASTMFVGDIAKALKLTRPKIYGYMKRNSIEMRREREVKNVRRDYIFAEGCFNPHSLRGGRTWLI